MGISAVVTAPSATNFGNCALGAIAQILCASACVIAEVIHLVSGVHDLIAYQRSSAPATERVAQVHDSCPEDSTRGECQCKP